ncbi:MAG: hypothetical protein IPK73_02005 [Candidatus Obscuribacter sp.]|nr:hypothetical protein [Candidatus Obscuribacter sp.]MBK9280224.1 hypothetical protein [Candidatus Obscuribacter sp.]
MKTRRRKIAEQKAVPNTVPPKVAAQQLELYPSACFSCCSLDLAELVKPNNLLKTRALLSAPLEASEAGAAEGILKPQVWQICLFAGILN